MGDVTGISIVRELGQSKNTSAATYRFIDVPSKKMIGRQGPFQRDFVLPVSKLFGEPKRSFIVIFDRLIGPPFSENTDPAQCGSKLQFLQVACFGIWYFFQKRQTSLQIRLSFLQRRSIDR